VSKGKTITIINSAHAVNLALEGLRAKIYGGFLWYDPTDSGNLAKLKLHRINRYLRQIERWRKEEHLEPLSRRKEKTSYGGWTSPNTRHGGWGW
jgi:hypothetical protein